MNYFQRQAIHVTNVWFQVQITSGWECIKLPHVLTSNTFIATFISRYMNNSLVDKIYSLEVQIMSNKAFSGWYRWAANADMFVNKTCDQSSKQHKYLKNRSTAPFTNTNALHFHSLPIIAQSRSNGKSTILFCVVIISNLK